MASRPHQHTSKCYKSVLNCARNEHTHVNRACYYPAGGPGGAVEVLDHRAPSRGRLLRHNRAELR